MSIFKFQPSLSHKVSPQDVSDTLEIMQRSNSSASQFFLRPKLFRLCMREIQTIRSFVEELCEFENDFAFSKFKLETKDRTFALLQELEKECNMKTVVLQNSSILSLEDKVSRLEVREE